MHGHGELQSRAAVAAANEKASYAQSCTYAQVAHAAHSMVPVSAAHRRGRQVAARKGQQHGIQAGGIPVNGVVHKLCGR